MWMRVYKRRQDDNRDYITIESYFNDGIQDSYIDLTRKQVLTVFLYTFLGLKDPRRL
mgnify:CR=1 FL=1